MIEYKHVRGHMDSKKRFKDLSRLEQLNVLCDKYAKEANTYLRPIPAQELNGEGLSLWHGEEKIYSDFREKIKSIYWKEKAKRIISNKYKWEDGQFENINWNASKRAMEMISNPLKIRISKVITKTLPVGYEMERRKEWKESFCPRCGKPDESPSHIIQCGDVSAREILKDSIAEMEKILVKMNTEPALQFQLLKALTEWLTIGSPTISRNTLIPIRKQILLGWDHLMEGRVHQEFERYIQQHYEHAKSRKNGEMWTAVLIQTIWTKIFDPMWEHRNKAVHILNDKDKKSREHLNLNFTINNLFSKSDGMQILYQDRYVFEEKRVAILRSSTTRKRGWILTAQQAIAASEIANAREDTRMQIAMRRFQTTGTCTECPPTTPTVRKRKRNERNQPNAAHHRRKRVKRNPFRKKLCLPCVRIQGNAPRHHIRKTDLSVRKRYKKNRYRKYVMRCPLSNDAQSVNARYPLTSIEEEWELKEHVKKK